MKKLFLSLTLFIGMFINAQDLPAEYKPEVQTFIDCFKNNDMEKLAALIRYPLKRKYPILPVKNKAELLKRFDEVFDKALVDEIKNSEPDKDWGAVGWRGITLGNGTVWLDYDGTVTAINHMSVAEEKMWQKLVAAEKKTLYESIKYFSDPVCILLTKKYRIRVDNMGEGTYRYACWKRSAAMSTKPDLIILNGEFVPDGSANYYFSFKNGEYEYRCGFLIVGADDSPPAYLTVLKNDDEILYQDAAVLEP